MKTFTIDNETNNITVHASAKEAEAVPNSERFSNEAALAKLAANRPAAQLVDIWNSLPGQTPVKKFKDRAAAVSRIWKAIQNLGQAVPAAADELGPVPGQTEEAAVQPEAVILESPEPAPATPLAPQTPNVAPEEAPAKKAPVAVSAGVPREGSKTTQVIAMLKREGGTTLAEIMIAMERNHRLRLA